MSTLGYSSAESIFQRLDIVRARRKSLRILQGLLAVAAMLLPALLITSATAGYWPDQPPAALRWSLLVVLAATAGISISWFFLRNFFWRQNLAQTARFIELSMPQLRNDLINSVLLSKDSLQASPELVELAMQETIRRADRVDLAKSISMKTLLRWAMAAGGACALLAGFAIFQFQPFSRGLIAIFSPSQYVPSYNRIELVSLEPGDLGSHFAGQPLTIVAKIKNPSNSPLSAEVIIDGVQNSRPMMATDANTTVSCQMGVVDQSFKYAVRIGNSRWPQNRPFYSVSVIKRVDVKGLDLSYKYPAYSHIKPRVEENAKGDVEAPLGSTVTVTLRLSAQAPAAVLEMKDGSTPQPMVADNGTMYVWNDIPILADGFYRIRLLDPRGKTFQQLPDQTNGNAAAENSSKGYYRIHAIPDDPPKVEFLNPGRDIAAGPGAKVPMRIRAYDKYGLTEFKLFAALQGQEPRPVDKFIPKLDGRGEIVADFTFDLSPYNKGDVVVYYAAATDNRDLVGIGGPQTTLSDKFKITVQDSAEVAAEKARRYEELRRRLMELLKIEEAQRVNCEICIHKHDDYTNAKAPSADMGKAIAAMSQNLLAAQRDVKAKLTDIVEKFPFDEDTGKLQGEIATLANNEAALAVEQAKTLAAMDLKDRMGRQGAMLAQTQDKIIDALQTLLAVMPSLANKKTPGEKSASRPSDLTPETRDKLTALRSDLEKFLDAQKKIIQASENLAKKPVDNYTAEDEKTLQDLKAQEDKWDKFLTEAFADFSKLAQQDFSNPALMKELISVKSDITMAKDALSKKAAEIATALEDNGIENAKTLTANIEKWLPDKPDREQWKMEDPGNGQTNIEQAELPKEMEDLVGDLLEQEEDLFKEMEDSTSKYAQSGDKGIGWDAADGPIANMNAQGVTGNQLPNSNEMSGRSGEGRQGKSSGEFVEDKAVGKGGRRTPTRLTPEPFQKGEVKDESSDPAGGSTGGGKVGGSGGEGLQGPVPPPLQKELQRLAGKQATLMNKAERISDKYQANPAAGVKLLEAITLMGRVQKDLESYRFRNALREKNELVDALGQSKLLLSGKIDVSADTSSNMPKYIMEDISDAAKGNMPEEYRDVLKQYYIRLSEQGGK